MLRRFHDLIQYPKVGRPLVMNVNLLTFQVVRNGDLIGVMNVVEHLRRRDNNPHLQFHVTDAALHKAEYCRKFRDFLLEQTDHLSPTPGPIDVPARVVSLWEYRGGVGDLVTIPNALPAERKIALFPLTDAPYNTYRNWPLPMLQEIIDHYSADEYDGYQKVMCSVGLPGVNLRGFTFCSDFLSNVRHAMTAETYIGGDTGMSHFVGVLQRGPDPIYVCHGAQSRLHTAPFHFTRKGRIIMY